MSERAKCAECGATGDDVQPSDVFWTAWGHNCFDFAWCRDTTPRAYCEACEGEMWRYCDGCGALVSAEHMGMGYLPEDGFAPSLCPECAPAQGYPLKVRVQDPPARVTGVAP